MQMKAMLRAAAVVLAVATGGVAQAAEPVQQSRPEAQGTQVASGELFAAPTHSPASVCKKKRVDPCGCHHVYGVRHCHPTRKTDHCEAPVRAVAPAAARPQSLPL